MRKGFTLIELLIVIGILAILATAVVLVINPAERLKESRDVQRISDLRSLRNAIDIYITTNPSPTLSGTVCVSGGTTFPDWQASVEGQVQHFMQPFQKPDPGQASKNISLVDLRKIDGAGWLPVPLNQTPVGSPLSKLPLDPINDASLDLSGLFNPPGAGYFYAYICKGLTYEINANMESLKYGSGGDRDVESKDGGKIACVQTSSEPPYGQVCDPITTIADLIYEIGNDPDLDL